MESPELRVQVKHGAGSNLGVLDGGSFRGTVSQDSVDGAHTWNICC